MSLIGLKIDKSFDLIDQPVVLRKLTIAPFRLAKHSGHLLKRFAHFSQKFSLPEIVIQKPYLSIQNVCLEPCDLYSHNQGINHLYNLFFFSRMMTYLGSTVERRWGVLFGFKLKFNKRGK